MQEIKDIFRIYYSLDLPVTEKIFLLKNKAQLNPHHHEITQDLVQTILRDNQAVMLVSSSAPVENISGTKKKYNTTPEQEKFLFPEKIFKTRRIGKFQKEIFHIKNIAHMNTFSSQKKSLTVRKKYFFLEDAHQKKFAVFAGLAFALVLSISPDLPLLAASTEISLIPSEGVETKGTLAYAFATGDFDFQTILIFGMHLIKLGGILAGMIYLIINVWAGLQYIVGATMDDKDAGKNTLINALLGFGLIVFSWIGVDILISFLTTT